MAQLARLDAACAESPNVSFCASPAVPTGLVPRAVVVDLDDIVQVGAIIAQCYQEALEHLEKWDPDRLAPESPAEEDPVSPVDLELASGPLRLLEAHGVVTAGELSLEGGSTTAARLLVATAVAFRERLQHGPVPYNSKLVAVLGDLKRAGCSVGLWSALIDPRPVLSSAKILKLFDVIVDWDVLKAFGLRLPPAADCVLKLCTDMAVSPYETIGLLSLRASHITAARNGSVGLIVGIPHAGEAVTVIKQALKAGADEVLQSMDQLEQETLYKWYVSRVQEYSWRLAFSLYAPELEQHREALTCVGNGYLGVRGAFEGTAPSADHLPGTYVAGLFDTCEPELPSGGLRDVLVRLPDWCFVTVAIGDGPFEPVLGCELLQYHQTLNLKEAVMERSLVFRNGRGQETRLESKRVASMSTCHVCALQFTITPLNYSLPVTLRSCITVHGGALEPIPILRVVDAGHIPAPDKGMFMVVETPAYRHLIAMHVQHNLTSGQYQVMGTHRQFQTGEDIGMEFIFQGREGTSYSLHKVMSLFTSRDPECAALAAEADVGRKAAFLRQLAAQELRHLTSYTDKGSLQFVHVFKPHENRWAELWAKADVAVQGDRLTQTMARLHTYHLLAAASPNSAPLDVGLPYSGLAGERSGYVMWDELFMFPYFLTKFPEVCHGHLMYRYRKLSRAKENAQELGFQGALYLWQSATEWTAAPKDISFRRRYHVNCAIFLNCWRYWRATQDRTMLEEVLAEIMLEIAMFWQSVASYSEDDNRFHIEGAIGPDTFHNCPEGYTDNAYTNLFAVWVLGTTEKLLDILSPPVHVALCTKVGITPAILERIHAIRHRMAIHFTEDGVIQQFRGFMDLEDTLWEDLQGSQDSTAHSEQTLLNDGHVEQTRLSRQPDLLMIYYVLSPTEVYEILEQLDYYVPENGVELLRKNYDFYCPRTSHTMPLSYAILTRVAYHCGKGDYLWNWFQEAAKSAILNRGSRTFGAVHCSAMAATLDCIVTCFIGMRELPNGHILVDPALPTPWQKVEFRRLLGGTWFNITVTKKKVRIGVESIMDDSTEKTIIIGTNRLTIGSWSTVTVKHNRANSVRHFYELMTKSKFVRQSIATSWFYPTFSPASISYQISALCHCLQALRAVTSVEESERCIKKQLPLDSKKRINMNIYYEVHELEKDLAFLEKGEEALFDIMRKDVPHFDKEVDDAVQFMVAVSDGTFHNLVTDRDGTINNYCDRYQSSIQSAYNSIFLTSFCRCCCDNAVILSAAPLQGMIDVSVNPDGTLVYGASKGREFLVDNVYHSADMPVAQRELMSHLNRRLKRLLATPPYDKFELIGSGLQFKFGQTTVSRQDMSKSIPTAESEKFKELVSEVMHTVAPNGELAIHDTDLDLEISPVLRDGKGGEEDTFHKGDGMRFLNERLKLQIEQGPNLICGDTSSDVSMVEAAMQLCPDRTCAIFCIDDPQRRKALVDRLHACCPRVHFVPGPDVLVTAMYKCSLLAKGKQSARRRSSHRGVPNFQNPRHPLERTPSGQERSRIPAAVSATPHP